MRGQDLVPLRDGGGELHFCERCMRYVESLSNHICVTLPPQTPGEILAAALRALASRTWANARTPGARTWIIPSLGLRVTLTVERETREIVEGG